MYSAKKLDVDRHVEECLKKINNETERNLRCFTFAKQYFRIERYEDARKYVSAYLSVKPNSAEAHYFLGRCLEMLGKKEAAFQAYSTSLRLDPKQNKLVIKICELLASDDVELDQSGAKYFCEMAQTFDPHNPAVFSLKQRIITSSNDNPSDVSNLLLKELENRPTDVRVRVRLLKHLLQHNMIKEAYKHAYDIESKDLPIFQNSLSWYETIAEVLVKYQKNVALSSNLNWEFWFLSVSVWDRLVGLSLDERGDNVKTSTEYITAVLNFDQTLLKATQNIRDCPDKQVAKEFINHYRGQLCFHLTTLIFKYASKDFLKYKEASNITLPLLFAAYHAQPPDLQSLWFHHCPENRRTLARKWRKEGAFRCSQAGHVLAAAAKDRKSILIEKASQYSTGMWREELYKKVFVTRDQQLKMSTSFFLTDQQLIEIVIRLPEKSDLVKYDEEAQLLHPDSLHHHIWIALNSKLSDVNCRVFDGLGYSIKHLKNCGAETLNILDIQAFIYCAAICAQSTLDHRKNIAYFNLDKPNVLPAAVTQDYGTLNQNTFFKAAYKMYRKEYDSGMDQIRMTLVEGIKILRCVDYSLDVHLLVTLANTFAERATNLSKQSEIEFNEARAELYWKAALPVLEKMKNNQAVAYTSNKLFNIKPKEMTSSEICSHIETGRLFSGVQLMKKKEHEKALRSFEVLKDPYASFYQAQIYKHMADQQTNQNRENVTSEMRSQNIILLSRARDCLYLTLDRLREPSVDPKHPLNAQLGTEIEKIERLLSRIDPDCTNRNECDGMSDENVSSNESAGDHYVTGYPGNSTGYFNGTFTSRADNHNNHSTPLRFDFSRREARPSAERLDAQLRQLTASKDAAISHILEHNKIMVESHRSLVDEWRSFKEAVNNLTSTVDDLKSEVKQSVSEFDSFKTVTDMVYEIKKEIAELKKDINKTSQLSEEDIYGLTNDYSTDYNINSNLAAAYNPNLYQNYQQRIPGASSLYAPPPPLYPLYPAMGYPYGGLGLPQVPGSLPLPPEQQLTPDFRGISAAALSQPTATYGQSTHPNLNQPTLPSTSLGVGLLAGQGLPQGASQPVLFRDTKTTAAAGLVAAPQTPFPAMSLPTLPVTRTPPVNVVITTSDPLPSNKTPTLQPVLSVTIPPQHLKGNVARTQPHNYQIALTTSSIPSTSPSILSKPPPTISTQSLLQNVAPPVYSAVSGHKTPINVTLGLQIEKSLDQTFSSNKNDSTLNVSNISAASSTDEHDPCPDFKPIIPLPDEVPVNTGEEDEIVLFCERAKLFRHVSINGNNEWKERGIGLLKILKNPVTGKIRILMRRDQVHKICANHFLTKDMTLTPKLERAYIWAAHDFADEEVVVEKLCARFKSAEEAKKFYDAFEEAKKNLSSIKKDNEIATKSTPLKEQAVKDTKPSAAVLGGFVFSSPPTFKPKEDTPVSTIVPQEAAKPSPFASFTFGTPKQTASPSRLFDFKPTPTSVTTATISPAQLKTSEDDSHVEDFVPTAEFKPVIPLPELVEVKTGEENCDVLFESRAKLLRFDTSGETKEWKERGIGVMKILKDSTIRLVMRREQVHKVCCNHQLLKNMNFALMTNNPKAVTWCAQDFSEGVLKAETFALRFKTEDVASSFLKAIRSAQESLDGSNCIANKQHVDKHMKSESSPKPSVGFGDKFKPAKGSWECKNCYIVNEGKSNYCMACETPKNDTVPKKNSDSSSGAAFSFGIPSPNFKNTTIVTAATTTTTAASSWGNAFKPKEGSWECKSCYIRNDADKTQCVSCETSKDGAPAKKSPEKSVNLDTGGLKFSFGVPSPAQTTVKQPEAVAAPVSTWGDAFKPKQGSWECKSCLVRNNPDTLYCLSCENPKDDTVPKKDTPAKGINLSTPGQTFTFGMPKASPIGDIGSKASFVFGQTTITPVPPFALTAKKDDTTPGNAPFNFKVNIAATPEVTASPKVEEPSDKFVFGSPQKHDFEFVPKSPRRVSTGQKDEESDNSYLEEECDNIYFKPVIPLPDKVEVKTGEEDEEVLYCHRAKLFRFSAGEWKERGLGDIKLLKKRDTGKLRVLMRREHVLKICLNHILTSDIKYLPKDDKTWLFSAPDFSDGEISNDQFCIRFKNAEIAQEFIKAVNDALGGASTDTGKKAESSGEDDDVQFVSETKVTPEEEKEAIKLQLPPKFMSYRQLPDCTCEQCKKEDEYLKGLPIKAVVKPSQLSTVSASKLSSIGSNSSSPLTITSTPNDSNTVLKSLLTKPSIFSAQKASTPPTLATPPVFSSNNNSATLFQSPSSNMFSAKSGSSIFGTPGQSPAMSSFSFASVFESPATAVPATAAPVTTAPATASPAVTKPGPLFGSSNFFGSGTNLFSTPPTAGISFGSSKVESTISTPTTVASTNDSTTVPATTSAVGAGPFFGSTGGATITGSIFASPMTAKIQESNIFGSKVDSSSTNVSDTTPSTTSGSLFGKPSAVFGTANTGSGFGGVSGGSLFGASANLFGTKTEDVPKTIFGGNTQTKDTTPVAPLFGGTQANAATDSSTTNLKEDDAVVLDCSSGLSFASLAANLPTDARPAFSKKEKETTTTSPFAFLGAGAPVFGSREDDKKSDKNKSAAGEEGDESVNADEEYDPHYEPIVPLPDAIVVSTGEEDETPFFNERAKLYRYDKDTKEWKERGVGQMKILHHPVNNTYRFLLRREQVHKVVLNQLIIPDLDIQPLISSDKAWTWAGYNFVDDSSALESLAVRFKNCELAQNFYSAVQDVIAKVKTAQSQKQLNQSQQQDQSESIVPVPETVEVTVDLSNIIPSSIQNYGLEDVSSDDQQAREDDEEDDEDDEDDDDDDDRNVMFMKRCTLSEEVNGAWKTLTVGDLQVYYDADIYAARICVNNDNGMIFTNTVIGMNTVMEWDRNTCTWRAVEWKDNDPHWRRLRATFSSQAAAEEFHCNFLEGLNYAQECDVVDEIPLEHDETE